MSKPPWLKIAESIREGIESGSLPAGVRLLSDVRLAEKWGVSRPTAHRALHELQRQGFVQRSRRGGTIVADSVAKATGRIAFIVDHMAAAYDFPQSDLILGIQGELGDSHNLLFCDCRDSAEKEFDYVQRMLGESDGIICYPTGAPANAVLFQEAARYRRALVVLDRIPEGLEIDAVLSDNQEATRSCIRMLIERGHRRIAFLSFFKPYVSTVAERFAGYRMALEEHGLPFDERLVRQLSPELEHDQVSRFATATHDALFALVKGRDPVTAVFCVQDMFAAAVLDLANDVGFRIPDDVEIATFNDWPPLMLRRPWNMHRIVPQRAEIGRAAAARLRLLIHQEAGDPAVQRILPHLFLANDPEAFTRGFSDNSVKSPTNGG